MAPLLPSLLPIIVIIASDWAFARTSAGVAKQVNEGRTEDPDEDDTSPQKILSIRTTADLFGYLKEKGIEDASRTLEAANCSAFASVQELRNSDYEDRIKRIVSVATSGNFKNKTYEEIAAFVDTFGSRMTGTTNLEDAIDYIDKILNDTGLVNRRSERVTVPAWTRGVERLRLLTPVKKDITFLGMGLSAGTSAEGVTAEALVVTDYDDLLKQQQRGNMAGKIVVVNIRQGVRGPMNHTSTYGAISAGGALAVLYRSTTSFSLSSPHTRRANAYYGAAPLRVPTGFLALEDIDLLTRIQKRKQKLTLQLEMHSTLGNSTSRNLFGDLVGRSRPEESVLVMAHTDTWDVGQGAQDDAFGLVLAINALQLLHQLQLVPRRTLRLAFWTAEELGMIGTRAFVNSRTHDPALFDNIHVAIEADNSCLDSLGFIFWGHPELGCILQEVNNLVGQEVSVGLVAQAKTLGSDVDVFASMGVPVVMLMGDNGRYYWYHHTEADTMTSLDSKNLDRCLALWTSAAYVLADLNANIPRVK